MGVEERLLRCADRLALADGGIGDETFHVLFDLVASGHVAAGKHICDDTTSFRTRLRQDGDLLAVAAKRVADTVGVGECAACEQQGD